MKHKLIRLLKELYTYYSKTLTVCVLSSNREESWVVPIWTIGGILTLAIILKILHLAAQHKG
jgi:hypothetical protein